MRPSLFPRPEDQEDTSTGARVPLPGNRTLPVATWVILGVNLALWLLTQFSGGSTDPDVLLRYGAMEALHIAAGDYWRLLTAIFLHSGMVHLGFNCVGLFIFGQQIEQLYGRSRFLLIYVVSGLAGSVASYSLNISLAPHSIGVGASGAIFGLLGALAAFFLYHRDKLGRLGRQSLNGLLVLAAVNLFFGFVISGVDNYAHIGGLVAGALLGVSLSPVYRPVYDRFGAPARLVDVNSILRRWWVAPAAGVVLISGTLLGNHNVGDSPLAHLREAEQYRLQGEFDLALDELDRAIEIDRTYGPTYLERALVMIELGNEAAATSDLITARGLGLSESDSATVVRLLIRIHRN